MFNHRVILARVARFGLERACSGEQHALALKLVLLIGLIGGIAVGSMAAARRTQSSFATFLASTRPFDFSWRPWTR